jgi:molybdopterin-guanine dinucleotide biosynthesis protein
MKIISVTGTASSAGKTAVVSYILRNLSNLRSCPVGEMAQNVNARTRHSYPGDIVGGVMKRTSPKKSFWRGGEASCYRNAGSGFGLSNHKRGWCALKITVRHEGSCPRHTGCDTCLPVPWQTGDSDYAPFRILTDDAIIKEKGKDTDQFSNAGADMVVWLQTDSASEKAGTEAALACFNKDDTIIVEGNSFLRVQDADIAILVASPSVKKVKRSTKLILDKIDLIAINVRKNHSSEQIEECIKQLRVIARHSESAIGMSCKAPYFVINPFVEDGYSNQTFIDRIQERLGISVIKN